MQLPKYEFIKLLGKGCYGSVNLVKFINIDGSSLHAAVKTCELDDHDSLYKETQILSKLKGCQRIVQCYVNNLQEDFNANGLKVYKMVMEYAKAGNLTSFIKKKRKKLTNSMIKDFTRMILEGLISIHNHDYVHCDLKPDNILIFPDGPTFKLKISDFGSASKVGEIGECWEFNSPFLGTPLYMSPESVKTGIAEKALDLWSLGCIVLEMFTGVWPWLGVDTATVESYLLNGKAPEIPALVPCDARKFLEKCFAVKAERGSALELLEHPFLSKQLLMTEEMAAGGGDGNYIRVKLNIRESSNKNRIKIPL